MHILLRNVWGFIFNLVNFHVGNELLVPDQLR